MTARKITRFERVAAPTYNPDRLLNAIAQVEGHQPHWLGGRYAITRGAWIEVTTWDYSRSKDPYYCDRVAKWRLEMLAARLKADGMLVNHYTLSGCWHLGYDGFCRANQNGWVDYAVRVAALAE